jgi:chemotaxis protein methyltransferase CheR
VSREGFGSFRHDGLILLCVSGPWEMIVAADYQFLGEMLRRESGLSLGSGKEYLLEARLAPIAANYALNGIAGLVAALRFNPDRMLVAAVCQAMTTQETLFFRDGTPYTILKDTILPRLIAARRANGNRPIRVWSAAASTGQEAYSVAMTVHGLGPAAAGVSVEILGTDYSPEAVARARAGLYNQFEVQRGLPVHALVQHFAQTEHGWQISDDLRRRVTFREANLLHPFGHLGQFDVIFCRNVLIYFDTDTKRDILDRLAAALAPQSYLLLGGAETPFNITDRLVRMPGASAGVYVRADAAQHMTAGARTVA